MDQLKKDMEDPPPRNLATHRNLAKPCHQWHPGLHIDDAVPGYLPKLS